MLQAPAAKIPIEVFSSEECGRVYELLDKYSIENGFIQELEESSDWIPDFRNASPFPGGGGENRIVWHWKTGLVP